MTRALSFSLGPVNALGKFPVCSYSLQVKHLAQCTEPNNLSRLPLTFPRGSLDLQPERGLQPPSRPEHILQRNDAAVLKVRQHRQHVLRFVHGGQVPHPRLPRKCNPSRADEQVGIVILFLPSCAQTGPLEPLLLRAHAFFKQSGVGEGHLHPNNVHSLPRISALSSVP